MTLWQLMLIFKARLRLFATLLVIGLLASLFWAFHAPSVYKATAQVLVNVRAPETVSTAGASELGVMPQLQPDYLATQLDIIRSDRVALAATKRLGLVPTDEDGVQKTDAASYAKLANEVRSDLDVSTSSQSRVISINFVSTDPKAAAERADAFAQAYRDVSLDLQADPARQASTWYKGATENVLAELTAAQKRLSEKRSQLGITGTSDQTDADDSRLAALSQQLAGLQAQRALQTSRLGGGALPDIMMNPVVQSLQNQITQLEARRRELATYAGPNNLDYQQVNNQLSSLRSQLEQQKALVRQSTQTNAAQSSASEAELRSAMETQRSRVIASQRDRGEIAALEQDVTNLKQSYQALVAKRTQASLLGAASQTNISILSPAAVPTSPSGLPRMLKLIVGLMLTALAASVVVFALEFLDQRMRIPEDAQLWLGVTNLGGIRSIETRVTPMLRGPSNRFLPRPEAAHAGEQDGRRR